MLFRIRKPGLALYSTGGECVSWKANGKIWSSLAAFAAHLALQTSTADKLKRAPESLFKLYGECMVVEIPENGIGAVTEVPFKQWYSKYFNTSEKFRAARKAEAQTVKGSDTKTDITNHVSAGSNSVAHSTPHPAVTNKSKKWDVSTKATVKRALEQSSKFVPNLKFGEFGEHPKTQETFAIIEISGKRYALLEI